MDYYQYIYVDRLTNKNIPKRIFIQIGEDASEIAGEFDFEKLVGVTWSSERKYKTDIEYVLKEENVKKPDNDKDN